MCPVLCLLYSWLWQTYTKIENCLERKIMEKVNHMSYAQLIFFAICLKCVNQGLTLSTASVNYYFQGLIVDCLQLHFAFLPLLHWGVLLQSLKKLRLTIRLTITTIDFPTLQSLVLTHHNRHAQIWNISCFLLLVFCCFFLLLASADLPGLLAVLLDSSCLVVASDPGLFCLAWLGADRLDKWQVCPLAPSPGPDTARCPCPCPLLGRCHQHKLGQIHQSRLSLLEKDSWELIFCFCRC